ncbi:anthranilate synthase component II [Candidatus Kinetoplastibacterium desouzaii TCC079E]|uniref:Anthranilate synthase component II n=1 Tax=Candidatus Kinetoplastidibacterium desouzai TCC079E TaxID=1208919 RepID=M1LLG7_9PROT|nr:aminodeoxychorismate/anthranilate synthase component II [Candidatus Kinetoplastibacterium desouzaii]AGF46602.1 anthranilate synthase component II [Candidatus Kinetoplastibacterium desouzaii TCC079E]
MLILIDNYDSFTYNLVQYFGELGEEVLVFRNDKITLKEISNLKPDHICISPGPCAPSQAGISISTIIEFAGKIPILGVCLGHQSIGEAYGGKIIRSSNIMHGKTVQIQHNQKNIFKNIPSPYTAIRYNSLTIDPSTLPECLEITATTLDGDIMGVKHKNLQVFGVQFHPESILSEYGYELLQNFLAIKK